MIAASFKIDSNVKRRNSISSRKNDGSGIVVTIYARHIKIHTHCLVPSFYWPLHDELLLI